MRRSRIVGFCAASVLGTAPCGGGVARGDDKWGEVLVAYVELNPGKSVIEAESIERCRKLLARFKVSKSVTFGEIPKTTTGKIQEFRLREMAREASIVSVR